MSLSSNGTLLGEEKLTAVAEQALIAIIDRLLTSPSKQLGLMGGLAGETLFLWYCHRYNSAWVNEDCINERIAVLQECQSLLMNNDAFSNGYLGVAWVLEIMLQQSDEYDSSINLSIDQHLYAGLVAGVYRESELLQGLSGALIYATRRARKTKSHDLVGTIIEQLEALTVQDDNELTWDASANIAIKKPDTERNFNLGFAHGVGGVVASLCLAREMLDSDTKLDYLIRTTSSWLLKQARDVPAQKSFYGKYCGDLNSARLAWCYGDLGNAYALGKAGAIIPSSVMQLKANNIARHPNTIDSQKQSIVDAGLCHGAAGLVMLYRQLSQLFGDDELEATADEWYQCLLKKYLQHGLKGFWQYNNVTGAYVDNPVLLEGYAGIGLCLLSELGMDRDWLDCLAIG